MTERPNFSDPMGNDRDAAAIEEVEPEPDDDLFNPPPPTQSGPRVQPNPRPGTPAPHAQEAVEPQLMDYSPSHPQGGPSN
jgi:hypothetical protein